MNWNNTHRPKGEKRLAAEIFKLRHYHFFQWLALLLCDLYAVRKGGARSCGETGHVFDGLLELA
jgi:hypothetical protein